MKPRSHKSQWLSKPGDMGCARDVDQKAHNDAGHYQKR